MRGFAPLIIVIVLALIGIAGYIVFRSTTIRSPTPDETANWETYNTTLFSFKYPPEMTAGPGHTKNNIQVWSGPTNTKTKEYYFSLKDRDLEQNRGLYSRVGQIESTSVDEKPTLIRKLTLNLKNYPANNITQVAIENVRFYKDGVWFDNGILYLAIYIDGDQVVAEKISEKIVKSMKFTDDIGPDQNLNLEINNASFSLSTTFWYECTKDNFNNLSYETCSINTTTNSKPEKLSTNFLIEFLPRNSYVSVDKQIKEIYPYLIDAKTSSTTISGEKVRIIEGRTTTNSRVEMTLWPYERDIAHKSVLVERPEGLYLLQGNINTTQLKSNFNQILSTFQFTE